MKKQAFTLIELLVVVLIIGILAAVAVPQYQKAVLKSRMSEAVTILDALKKSVTVWVLTNGMPSEGYSFFTGGEEDVIGTDIELGQNLDCPGGDYGHYCYSKDKNLGYQAYCRPEYCSVQAYSVDKNKNDWTNKQHYFIALDFLSSTQAWEIRCDALDDIGYQLCESFLKSRTETTSLRDLRPN